MSPLRAIRDIYGSRDLGLKLVKQKDRSGMERSAVRPDSATLTNSSPHETFLPSARRAALVDDAVVRVRPGRRSAP